MASSSGLGSAALINGAEVILATSPRAQLNRRRAVTGIASRATRRRVTIILITHDSAVAEHADRQIHLLDGKIVTDTKTAAPSTSESFEKNAASVQHVHSQGLNQYRQLNLFQVSHFLQPYLWRSLPLE